MFTIKTYSPHYGPQGQPFRVRARYQDYERVQYFWTEREAYEARDEAFNAGSLSVHVSGLPTIVAHSGFPQRTSKLPPVD